MTCPKSLKMLRKTNEAAVATNELRPLEHRQPVEEAVHMSLCVHIGDSRQDFNREKIADANELRALIDYDPMTGAMRWRKRDINLFQSARIGKGWNTKFAGKEIPRVLCTSGYQIVCIWDRHYLAHRIAWAIYYGEFPKQNIDHINGDRTDNRICNLRDVSQRENARNQRLRSDNKSGIGGIWDNKPKKGGRRWAIAMGGQKKMIWKNHHCLGQAIKERNEIYRIRGFTVDHGIRKDGV